MGYPRTKFELVPSYFVMFIMRLRLLKMLLLHRWKRCGLISIEIPPKRVEINYRLDGLIGGVNTPYSPLVILGRSDRSLTHRLTRILFPVLAVKRDHDHPIVLSYGFEELYRPVNSMRGVIDEHEFLFLSY